MRIQFNPNLAFKSELKTSEKEKAFIRTPKELSEFIKKYEPILYEPKSGYSCLKETISGAEYTKMKNKKFIREQMNIGDPIEGDVKVGVNGVKKSFYNFRDLVANFNNYHLGLVLEDGLNNFVKSRRNAGVYEFKSPNNPNEIALIQYNQNKDYFKILVKDKNDTPKRWYFFVGNYFIKNYDPYKGFEASTGRYGQLEDVEAIKKPLLKDLAWIKTSLEQSCNFIKENKTYKKILLLKK